MNKKDIPCVMRVTEGPDSFELLVEADGDNPLPKEAVLICILMTAIKFSKGHGMNVEDAMKDVLGYERMDTMEMKVERDLN